MGFLATQEDNGMKQPDFFLGIQHLIHKEKDYKDQ